MQKQQAGTALSEYRLVSQAMNQSTVSFTICEGTVIEVRASYLDEKESHPGGPELCLV